MKKALFVFLSILCMLVLLSGCTDLESTYENDSSSQTDASRFPGVWLRNRGDDTHWDNISMYFYSDGRWELREDEDGIEFDGKWELDSNNNLVLSWFFDYGVIWNPSDDPFDYILHSLTLRYIFLEGDTKLSISYIYNPDAEMTFVKQ